MRLLVGIPTLSRADLLVRNREFLESICLPDLAIVLDNGGQSIDIECPIVRTRRNLGVGESWNWFLRRAFAVDDFDALVLLQDDIIWDRARLEAARRLLAARPDVALFLSYLQFSVQVQTASNYNIIGPYDEQFPGYGGDDDWAIRLTETGRVYERFRELDPLPGSQIEGTPKPTSQADADALLAAKWGKRAFGVNVEHAPWYRTNRDFIST